MAKKKRKQTTMTIQLRDAINDSPLSFAALERETGLLRQTLMKFSRGETSLRLDKADQLAEYFGLELTERKGRSGAHIADCERLGNTVSSPCGIARSI